MFSLDSLAIQMGKVDFQSDIEQFLGSVALIVMALRNQNRLFESISVSQ